VSFLLEREFGKGKGDMPRRKRRYASRGKEIHVKGKALDRDQWNGRRMTCGLYMLLLMPVVS